MLQAQEKRIWGTPLYADFPRSEYGDRVRCARAYMAERELAALRPIGDIDRFGAELADASFVDACDLIWKCRAIKPGVQAKHLLDVIDQALRDEGMDSTIEMAGHGVGLNTQEPPMIAEEEDGCDPFPSFRRDIRSLPHEGRLQ